MKSPKLYIPVLLGSAREGRKSEKVARFVLSEFSKRPEIETELIDVRNYLFGHTIPSWESDPRVKNWREIAKRADGFLIVSPEYNNSFPGELKIWLDSALTEYAKKPAGICGVSSGRYGGARMQNSLRPVLVQLGLVPTRSSALFPAVEDLFESDSKLKFKDLEESLHKLFDELLWYAKVLKAGRTQS